MMLIADKESENVAIAASIVMDKLKEIGFEKRQEVTTVLAAILSAIVATRPQEEQQTALEEIELYIEERVANFQRLAKQRSAR